LFTHDARVNRLYASRCARLPLFARQCDKHLILLLFLEACAYRPATDLQYGRSPIHAREPRWPNAIDPQRMTTDERLAEIGRLLGLGLIRLHASKSRSLSADSGDSCLDFPPSQRRHADTRMKRKA
jgi:hypothetical protein